jgi:hypothetical protein
MQNMAKMMMMMMTFVKIGVMKLKTTCMYMNIQENKMLHLNCVKPQHFDFNKRSATNYCLKFSHARFVIKSVVNIRI